MPRLLKIAQKSALVLTGVTIGAALWKSRSGANGSGEAGPLKESVTDLEFRLAALENGGIHIASEKREDSSTANTLAAVASLEASVASLTTRYDSRLTQLESRVGDHDAKLKELPTLAQVVSTMEEMLSSTMSGLDQKLSEQVRSIDVLKTTVAQSDELMERVLDSIYSLQSHVAENDKSEVPVSV
jgi:uncharacterized coiled-coil protein SlyX